MNHTMPIAAMLAAPWNTIALAGFVPAPISKL
jgi:hypothetical protein